MTPAKKKMTGAEVLLKTLQDSGVDLMVGYTGGTIMPIFDKFKNFPKLKFITCRHEQGAGFIAQGYARACGKVAPLLVTSGPGATNTITPVADAMMDSVPMLTIAGQVALDVVGTDAFQETDVVGLMYPITKYAVLPDSADEIAKTVGQMMHLATHGRRGPTAIDLPKNTQFDLTENIEIPKDLDLPNKGKIPKVSKISKAVKSAAKLIKEAKRPVALVGHGVVLSNAEKEIIEFIETTNTPAALTMHGLSSIPSDHKLNLGMMGMHGEVEANKGIEEADLLIALGMRFDDRVTGKLSEYAKHAKIIHVEIDFSEIDKNVPTDIQIHADMKNALHSLSECYEENVETKPSRKEWFKSIDHNKELSKKYYNHIFEKGVGESGKLLMTRVIHELSDFTKGKDNIVTDVGQHQMQTAKFYKFNRFNTWFSSGGLGTMGFGLPASIGVKLARPDEEVWCVAGDGGFQMNIQELGTILQENLNVNILLMNNSYLGMVRQWQDLFFEKNRAETPMISPNYEHLTKAYNVGYRKVEKLDDIKPALEWSKKETRTTIVEFICDSDEQVYPMIPAGAEFSKMILGEEQE